MSGSTVPVRNTAVAMLAAGVLAVPASAAVRTTNPEPIRNEHIVLTDKAIHLSVPTVVRGSLVRFFVRNGGTTARDFFIAGYIVHGLKPGRTRNFQLQFLERGKYPYYSAAHPGKRITGLLIVT